MPWDTYRLRATYLFPPWSQISSQQPESPTELGTPKPCFHGMITEDIPPSAPQAPTTTQLLHQILEKLDRQEQKAKLRERRNKRRFTYLKEMIMGKFKDSDTPDSTSFTSTGSHDGPDYGDTATSPPLFLTDGTEDGAKP
ncbi:hypothetical protein AHAS_Ahas20G0241100 [Arachis hypogaea]